MPQFGGLYFEAEGFPAAQTLRVLCSVPPLQDEIVDETDVYVDLETKQRVKRHTPWGNQLCAVRLTPHQVSASASFLNSSVPAFGKVCCSSVGWPVGQLVSVLRSEYVLGRAWIALGDGMNPFFHPGRSDGLTDLSAAKFSVSEMVI